MIGTKRQIDTPEFLHRIDDCVLSQIQNGTRRFAELLRALPSIYPTSVILALDRLMLSRRISARTGSAIREDAEKSLIVPRDGRTLLPLPHPLDFEWRFTADTSRFLLDLASDVTGPGDDVLLFGTPGLAVEAMALPIDRRVTLLAEDNAVTRRLVNLNSATGSSLAIDFCSVGLPRDAAQVVILDPPWYMDFIRPMLAAATAACRQGGVILLSMPPAYTRPTAEVDQHATLKLAARLGLELIEHRPLAIGYDTPFFEANALAAGGVYAPSQWRRGDLMVLRKVRNSSRLAPAASHQRRGWVEVEIGRMRLFVKVDREGDVDCGMTGLLPLIANDILPTVSRRHPRRRHAQVWTSGNRIFRTDNARLVLEAAYLQSGRRQEPGAKLQRQNNFLERKALAQVGDQLVRLAELEAAEERNEVIATAERSKIWTWNSTNCSSRSKAMVSG